MSTFLEDHYASVELRFLEASDGCSTYFPACWRSIYVHLANRFSITSRFFFHPLKKGLVKPPLFLVRNFSPVNLWTCLRSLGILAARMFLAKRRLARSQDAATIPGACLWGRVFMANSLEIWGQNHNKQRERYETNQPTNQWENGWFLADTFRPALSLKFLPDWRKWHDGFESETPNEL